jgi:hypothetical protein
MDIPHAQSALNICFQEKLSYPLLMRNSIFQGTETSVPYFAESTRLSPQAISRSPQKGKNYWKAVLKMRLEMKKERRGKGVD